VLNWQAPVKCAAGEIYKGDSLEFVRSMIFFSLFIASLFKELSSSGDASYQWGIFLGVKIHNQTKPQDRVEPSRLPPDLHRQTGLTASSTMRSSMFTFFGC